MIELMLQGKGWLGHGKLTLKSRKGNGTRRICPHLRVQVQVILNLLAIASDRINATMQKGEEIKQSRRFP